ncbi:hypothetical protein vBPFY1MI_51 [Pseudomonas phage vB_PF_Y1-MI]|nr:hypothetical protein vBPFY1MI_51 [Pseudomonas phage vB_PF_Y1-MI]
MPILTVGQQTQQVPKIARGVIMIHNEEPPLIVLVTEVVSDESFMGTSLEDGVHIEWITGEFKPFIGKLALEQQYV